MARILLVDDDPDILKLTGTVLRHAGHDVQTAEDGRQAFDMALRDRPHLVVTDIMMPKMDGWGLVRWLRAHPQTAFVPVIFLTSLGDAADRMRGFSMGGDDYLTKPYIPSELVNRVDRMIDARYLWAEAHEAIQPKSDLEGNLARIGLSGVLILLEAEKKTGVLLLKCGLEEVQLFIRDGAVVDGKISGRSDHPPEEAVFFGLTFSDGTFEFSKTPVEGPDKIGTPVTYLLIEGARRLDEDEGREGEDPPAGR
jgi:CheY-like chemotaxis protein